MQSLGLEHIHNLTETIHVPEAFSEYIGGACRMFKIKAKEDSEYQELVNHFRSGEGRNTLVDKTFYGIWNDVSMEDSLLLYESKLLVLKFQLFHHIFGILKFQLAFFGLYSLQITKCHFNDPH